VNIPDWVVSVAVAVGGAALSAYVAIQLHAEKISTLLARVETLEKSNNSSVHQQRLDATERRLERLEDEFKDIKSEIAKVAEGVARILGKLENNH
jgi:FtsZ-binding cell division protein ZapB